MREELHGFAQEYRARVSLPRIPHVALVLARYVVLTHIAEALRLFPFMGLGRDHSIGHHIDLSSAVLGATLFPLGYLLQTLAREKSRQGSPIVGCAEPSVTKRQAREDKQVEDG